MSPRVESSQYIVRPFTSKAAPSPRVRLARRGWKEAATEGQCRPDILQSDLAMGLRPPPDPDLLVHHAPVSISSPSVLGPGMMGGKGSTVQLASPQARPQVLVPNVIVVAVVLVEQLPLA